MATNPLVDQGTLNRLRGSVVWNDFPELNVTAPYLGDAGIGLSLEGETTEFINTLAGAVVSPQPYMILNVRINLLKTQNLSDLYKRKMETNAQMGQGTIRPDSRALSPYPIFNSSIQSVDPLSLNGRDAGFVVAIKGYYTINTDLFAI